MRARVLSGRVVVVFVDEGKVVTENAANNAEKEFALCTLDER